MTSADQIYDTERVIEEFTGIFSVPKLVKKSSKCSGCDDKFSMTTSKAHCRLCGMRFCTKCVIKQHLPQRFQKQKSWMGNSSQSSLASVCFVCKERCQVQRQKTRGDILLRRGAALLQSLHEDTIKLHPPPSLAPMGMSSTCNCCGIAFGKSKFYCNICGDLSCSDCILPAKDLPRIYGKGLTGSLQACRACDFKRRRGAQISEQAPTDEDIVIGIRATDSPLKSSARKGLTRSATARADNLRNRTQTEMELVGITDQLHQEMQEEVIHEETDEFVEEVQEKRKKPVSYNTAPIPQTVSEVIVEEMKAPPVVSEDDPEVDSEPSVDQLLKPRTASLLTESDTGEEFGQIVPEDKKAPVQYVDAEITDTESRLNALEVEDAQEEDDDQSLKAPELSQVFRRSSVERYYSISKTAEIITEENLNPDLDMDDQYDSDEESIHSGEILTVQIMFHNRNKKVADIEYCARDTLVQLYQKILVASMTLQYEDFYFLHKGVRIPEQLYELIQVRRLGPVVGIRKSALDRWGKEKK